MSYRIFFSVVDKQRPAFYHKIRRPYAGAFLAAVLLCAIGTALSWVNGFLLFLLIATGVIVFIAVPVITLEEYRLLGEMIVGEHLLTIKVGGVSYAYYMADIDNMVIRFSGYKKQPTQEGTETHPSLGIRNFIEFDHKGAHCSFEVLFVEEHLPALNRMFEVWYSYRYPFRLYSGKREIMKF